MSRLGLFLSVAIVVVVAAVLPAAAAAGTGSGGGDTARYILPPGNYGGLPFTDNSTDQLPLYSGLTPLRDNITNGGHRRALPARGLRADRRRHTEEHRAARAAADLRRLRRSRTSTARPAPTSPSAPAGRRPATASSCFSSAADRRGRRSPTYPNIDAFSLVTSGQSFVPSAATEALVTKQRHLLVETYGEEGQADHRRRPGLRRRHQRLHGGERHRPAAGDGQRRDRRDRLHRLDLRRRRRRRGRQRRPARQARSRSSASSRATTPGTT